MTDLKYVMNDLEKQLYHSIQEDGLKATLSALVRATIEYSHHMSDMKIGKRANQAWDIADALKDVRDVIEE